MSSNMYLILHVGEVDRRGCVPLRFVDASVRRVYQVIVSMFPSERSLPLLY